VDIEGMTAADAFNPSRLTWARRRRGMSKMDLAAALEVHLGSVVAYETGEFRPDPDRLRRIARTLKFPEPFFVRGDLDEPGADTASFRSMFKRSAAQRDKALACGVVAFLLNDWIEARFPLPELALPPLPRKASPETAADAVRLAWRLGDLPIENVVQLLEAKGIRVYSLPLDLAEVDTFSLWHQDRPFVFLNTVKSLEHSRFDAARELGHLVLHRSVMPRGKDEQQEADDFASVLLMPAAGLRGQALKIAMIDELTPLTRNWGVSLAAMARRLHRLGLLSDWQHRKLHDHIVSREQRRARTDDRAPETSQALQTAFAALKRVRATKREISDAVSVRPEDINELVFGLLRTVLDGAAPPAPDRDRPRLRLISARK
jgi:Zn-dependent peptidase ImmA (M78 family)/DNA-binding XRE family transcriptional regulator